MKEQIKDFALRTWIRLKNDQDGLTAMEYAVLGGIVVGVLAVAGVAFGSALTTAFSNMTSTLTSAHT